jgi:Fic family protein
MPFVTTLDQDTQRDIDRAYEQSHPWIRFSLDLQAIDWRFWTMVGEARSKCRHLAYTPLPPGLAGELSALYLAKGVHATTAIEGNTLSEEQALDAVRGQLRLPESQQYMGREIDNILRACGHIEQRVFSEKGFEISPARMRELNRRVLEGLEVDEHVVPGEFRTTSVGVGGVYRGAPWQDCEYLVERLCDWLNGRDFAPQEEDPRDGFLRAILKAAMAHVYLAWIHPFGDGNGRTARLLEFGILTAAGVPTVAAHLLSNHYNATRAAYYRQLDYASKSGGDLQRFLLYAIRGFVEQLHEQLVRVHAHTFSSAWTVYVHEVFGGDSTPATRRQRDVVLDLGDQWVPRARITTLTPRLAEAYAGKGTKTLTRDLNALQERGLIERGPKGIRARRAVMLGFLPPVAAPLVTED